MQFLGIIEQRANDLLLAQAKLNFMALRKWEADAQKMKMENAIANPGTATTFEPADELGPKPEVHGVLGTGPKSLSSTTEITKVALPTSAEDYEDDDEDDEDESLRPLTHAELKTRIVKTMKIKKEVAQNYSASKQLEAPL